MESTQISQKEFATFYDQSPSSRKKLVFNTGSNFFRQRLVLSILSSKAIKIEEIRSASDMFVGLKPYELSFIQLISELTNGTKIKISETGTEVQCIPGIPTGGHVTFTTDTSRPLSYYLEPILLLAPFCKQPLSLNLKGRLQNDSNGYNSIYKVKHSALPILQLFGLTADLQVVSRSCELSEIKFTCTIRKQLITLRNQLNSDCGKVKKIRGLAYGYRVSPQLLNRIVTTAKGIFLPYLSDVYITTDQVKRSKSKKPGYGVVLYGTTTKDIVYTTDGFIGRKDENEEDDESNKLTTVISRNLDNQGIKRKFDIFDEEEETEENSTSGKNKKSKKRKWKVGEKSTQNENDDNDDDQVKSTTAPKRGIDDLLTPEELGTYVAKLLLKEMSSQSCVDSVYQWLIIGLMALSPRDISSVVLGQLTPYTIQFLRDLKTYFGITFKVEDYKQQHATIKNGEDSDDDEHENQKKGPKLYKLSCLGTGYINLNKTMI